MPIRHSLSLLFTLLPLLAQAMPDCATALQCNQVGTAAYQAGRFDEAIAAFERQLRRVESEDVAKRSTAAGLIALAVMGVSQR